MRERLPEWEAFGSATRCCKERFVSPLQRLGLKRPVFILLVDGAAEGTLLQNQAAPQRPSI